jgi:hypothetical protein
VDIDLEPPKTMKLIETLETLKQSPTHQSGALQVHLACGFMQLHLLTFFQAHLRRQFQDDEKSVSTELFGSLERLEESHPGGHCCGHRVG